LNDNPQAPSVLVVEDYRDAADSLAILLRLSGFPVTVARDGESALDTARAATPDVVLLDIGLPRMTGWEVATRLRDQCHGKQPYVIAVTGRGTDRDRFRSADAGIDLHLVKPVEPAVLVGVLEQVQHALTPGRADGN
jgi:DNA-binding response OmpR family regulator